MKKLSSIAAAVILAIVLAASMAFATSSQPPPCPCIANYLVIKNINLEDLQLYVVGVLNNGEGWDVVEGAKTGSSGTTGKLFWYQTLIKRCPTCTDKCR